MKRTMKCLGLAGAVATGVVLAVPLAGKAGGYDYYSPRQYYSSWYKPPKKDYYYRYYYYKPEPEYTGYKYHYVICPKKSDYYYYYNPESGQYWGRCPIDYGTHPGYSMLAERDRKPTLEEIPESAFPPPGPLPKIPGAKDNARLDLPPSRDIPEEARLPK